MTIFMNNARTSWVQFMNGSCYFFFMTNGDASVTGKLCSCEAQWAVSPLPVSRECGTIIEKGLTSILIKTNVPVDGEQ